METEKKNENKEIEELKNKVEELTKEVADLKDMCTYTYSDVACCMMAAELLIRKNFEEVYGHGGDILRDVKSCLQTINCAKLADSFYMHRFLENNSNKEEAKKVCRVFKRFI